MDAQRLRSVCVERVAPVRAPRRAPPVKAMAISDSNDPDDVNELEVALEFAPDLTDDATIMHKPLEEGASAPPVSGV